MSKNFTTINKQIINHNNTTFTIILDSDVTGDATGGYIDLDLICPDHFPNKHHITLDSICYTTDDLTNAPLNNLYIYAYNFHPVRVWNLNQTLLSLPMEYTLNQTQVATTLENIVNKKIYLGRSIIKGTSESTITCRFTPNSNLKTYTIFVKLTAQRP